MSEHVSIVDGRRYRLGSAPAVEYKGQWHPAHLVQGTYGTSLVPDDGRLPIEACVWVEYAAHAAKQR